MYFYLRECFVARFWKILPCQQEQGNDYNLSSMRSEIAQFLHLSVTSLVDIGKTTGIAHLALLARSVLYKNSNAMTGWRNLGMIQCADFCKKFLQIADEMSGFLLLKKPTIWYKPGYSLTTEEGSGVCCLK